MSQGFIVEHGTDLEARVKDVKLTRLVLKQGVKINIEVKGPEENSYRVFIVFVPKSNRNCKRIELDEILTVHHIPRGIVIHFDTIINNCDPMYERGIGGDILHVLEHIVSSALARNAEIQMYEPNPPESDDIEICLTVGKFVSTARLTRKQLARFLS